MTIQIYCSKSHSQVQDQRVREVSFLTLVSEEISEVQQAHTVVSHSTWGWLEIIHLLLSKTAF